MEAPTLTLVWRFSSLVAHSATMPWSMPTRPTPRTPGTAVGDPTETALVYAAAQAGLWKAELERQFPRSG